MLSTPAPSFLFLSLSSKSQRLCLRYLRLLACSRDLAMDGEDDWDLAAVVRGCCSKAKATAAVPDPFSTPLFNETLSFSVEREQEEEIFPKFFPNIFPSTSRRFEGLEELYTPFLFRHLQRQTEVCSAAAAAADPTSTFCVPKKPQRPACSQAPRSKRRKKQLKKVVCQVPADGVSSDVWAWRKYGQKPIKGSPYPRGYYRCSSFRGCPARKQVERNRSDPGQLIITYTSEHNHPMPARHKFPSAPLSSSPAAADSASAEVRTDNGGNIKETDQPASSPATSASVDGDDEEMLMVEDMEMIGEDELVFVGDASMETLATEGASLFEDDGEFDDRLFTSPPWLDNSSATAAAC